MNYKIIGDKRKPAVVFLHGWGGSIQSFSGTTNYINYDKYCTLNLDFYGFGESKFPNKDLYMIDYAKGLENIIANEKLDCYALVGHSFGGRVAIKYLSTIINNVKKLVLIDSAGIPPKKSILTFLKKKKYKLAKILVKIKLVNKSRLIKYGSSDYKTLPIEMKKTFINIINEDLSENAKSINTQTLIVWGKNDKDTPLYMAKKLNKYIRNSELIVFDNAGHYSYIDNFTNFIYILNSFLN